MKQQKVRPEEFSSNHLDAPSLNVQLFSLHIMWPFSLHFHLKEAIREFVQNPLFSIGTVFARAKLHILLQSHNRLKIAFFEKNYFGALQSRFLLLFLQMNLTSSFLTD